MGEFGATKQVNTALLKPYIKTEQGGSMVQYATTKILLNPPFDLIEGSLKVEDMRVKLRFFINGFDCSSLFATAQSGRIITFEFLQNPILYKNQIALEIELYRN